ncbi:hypothetical protein [Piscirickettsia litoralis]|uniref:Uncharacterized protein n=1 Tax=Piscirickettsia litoralis TaxID=1891921 RepID=A0ABX3A441_9GAMM|nr:hypothetical protein [Piscirickettsia litoralis]ODN43012.1 hypothetical protein BGC07_08915 [Piscirickettsia litoralis]
MLEAKAKYVVRKHDGKWEAQTVDVIFDYKNEKMKKYLDNRGGHTRLKDCVKNVFDRNQEKKTITKREAKYLFLTAEQDNKKVGRYMDKSIEIKVEL